MPKPGKSVAVSAAAKRNAAKRNPGHNRGGRRGEIEEEKLLDAIAFLVEHRTSREQMSRALAEEFGRPPGTPIPLSTLDENIAKLRARWQAEAELTRAETKKMQLRRLYRRLRNLKGAKNYREAADLEKLIAKIEGNEEPKRLTLGTPDGKPLPVALQHEPNSDELRRELAELEAKAAAARAKSPDAPAAPAPADPPGPDDDDGPSSDDGT